MERAAGCLSGTKNGGSVLAAAARSLYWQEIPAV